MKAVGQERRSAAQPAKHPSGEKIAGDGTWGEGKPPFAETPISPPTRADKRGSPAPAIGLAGTPGEVPAPSGPAPMPDKRGGPTPRPMLGSDASAGSGGPAPAEPRDPCDKKSEIRPDGSQPKQAPKTEEPPPLGFEVACRKGQVHSAAAGRSFTRNVPSAAAPDGAFQALTGEGPLSPPQGPGGGFAGAPEKAGGNGTAHVAVGSCAPQSPSMTVRMPPSHPAIGGGPAPRPRPSPAVPAFGARAALRKPTERDNSARAPRGLGVSQIHLSGPMLRAAPQPQRSGARAEAPPGSTSEGPTAGSSSSTAAPRRGGAADVQGAGLVAPTGAQQAAASARGIGGGGGEPSAVQQYATNINRSAAIREDIKASQARQKDIERALELQAKVGSWTAGEKEELTGLAHKLGTGDPPLLKKKLKAEQEREKELGRKDRAVADENTDFKKKLTAKEKERAADEAKRQLRTAEKRERKQKLKEGRPDYRATERAKAKRAGNKREKNLLKASKLLKAAKNPNMSKSAKKKAVEKAKKALQKAKEEGQAKIESMQAAGASDDEVEAEMEKQAEKNAELERDIAEVEAQTGDVVAEPDPCALPCDCNIVCDPPDLCICSRPRPGTAPLPRLDEAGGGDWEPKPPDLVFPEGTTTAEEKKGDGDGQNGDGEPSGGKRGGAIPPRGGILLDVETPDGGPINFQEKPDEPPNKEVEPEGEKQEPDPEKDQTTFEDKVVDEMEAFPRKKPKANFDPDEPLASAPEKGSKWTVVKGDPHANEGEGVKDGISTTDPAAAIREMFDKADEFGFDCASAVIVVEYKALLDVIGDDRFNRQFETASGGHLLIIQGAWSSGTKKGNARHKEAYGATKVPQIFAELANGPYRAGDIRYVSPGGSGEHGENVIQRSGGDPGDSDLVFGHGPTEGDAHGGVRMLSAFKRAYHDETHEPGELSDGAWRVDMKALLPLQR